MDGQRILSLFPGDNYVVHLGRLYYHIWWHTDGHLQKILHIIGPAFSAAVMSVQDADRAVYLHVATEYTTPNTGSDGDWG